MSLSVVRGSRPSSGRDAVLDGREFVADDTDGEELVSLPCCMRLRLRAFSLSAVSLSFFDRDEERDLRVEGSFGDSYIPLAVEGCCCIGFESEVRDLCGVRGANAFASTKAPLPDE